MKKIVIADNLSFPVDVVTQTVAILAKRRVGKSYLMRRIVEQLFKAGQQVILVDPKGDQWGLRSAADGKGAGLPFVILGGERGDVPLEAGAGAVVAKMLVEERVSAVIDLSLFRKREVAEFMGGPTPPRGNQEGFLEVLYHMKAQERFRTPVMLVLDEGDAIAPQNPAPGEERMLGAAEDIVRRGGQRGLGCIVVTQRSAVLNKNVLTQSEILIALRTISPQDLKAMKAWIDVHGEPEQRETLMASLPSLPVGDAWVWSPGWPTAEGIFQRVHTLPIETFDSAATPKPGERRIEPKTVADVDLDALRTQMAETIERAKADDPKELKKRIAELERDLKTKLAATPNAAAPSDRDLQRIRAEVKREVRAEWEPLVKERDAALRERDAKLSRIGRSLQKAHAALEESAAELGKEMPKLSPVPAPQPEIARVASPHARQEMRRATQSERASTVAVGDLTLTKKQQQILDGLAWLESIGNEYPSNTQLGAVALIDTTGGYFSNVVGPLSSAGLVERGDGHTRLTDAGRALADLPERVASLADYHDVLRSRILKMKSAARRTIDILDFIISKRGKSVTTAEIGEAVGIDHTGGYFSNMIGPLSTAGVIERREGVVTPTDVLFPEGLS